MNQKVLVSIKGLHKTPDGEDTVQTLQTGEYKNILGSHVIRYDELLEEETSPEAATVSCMLKITPDSISLTKKGAMRTQMRFTRGRAEETLYHTPLGSLHLTVYTHELEVSQTQNRLCVSLSYDLEMNGSPVSRCCLSIDIKDI